MHSLTLYGVILGQWPREVCVSYVQCPRSYDTVNSHELSVIPGLSLRLRPGMTLRAR